MSQDQPRYLSYLIRMWQVKTVRGWQWRAFLESPGSGDMIAGLGFIFIPNTLLSLFRLPETNEVWIRVVGLLAFFVGGYYLVAARNNLIQFYQASAVFRIPFALGLFSFVLLGFSGPGLAIIGMVDILGAAWTWWGLRSESVVKGFATKEFAP